MKSKKTLLTLRNIINTLDYDLVTLLYKRNTIATKIAKIKIKKKYPIRDIKREQLLLNNITKLGKKYNLDYNYIYEIFQVIIKNSISIQKAWIENNYQKKEELKSFSLLGNLGSYSYYAVQKYSERNFEFFSKNYYNNFQEIIDSVENKKSDYAILPIENNSSGYIDETYNLLKNTKLFIISEINISINHCLLSQRKTQFINIETVYSHRQPFMQCSKFVKYFPHWSLKYTDSTIHAVQQLSNDENYTFAALGSESCAKIYKLKIIAKNISNLEKNITRFIILRKKKQNVPINIQSITTIMISSGENKNLIIKVKNILKEHNLEIKRLKSHIYSQSSKNAKIFIDIKNNINTSQMQKALKKLKNITSIKILGCYPEDKYLNN
ncbi:MAG: prephenate dehydratase domain-containing protein [Buchnera aphidicola (Nurudea shiraii)]